MMSNLNENIRVRVNTCSNISYCITQEKSPISILKASHKQKNDINLTGIRLTNTYLPEYILLNYFTSAKSRICLVKQ